MENNRQTVRIKVDVMVVVVICVYHKCAIFAKKKTTQFPPWKLHNGSIYRQCGDLKHTTFLWKTTCDISLLPKANDPASRQV